VKTTYLLLLTALAATPVLASKYDEDKDHLNMGAIYEARHFKDHKFFDDAVNQQRLGKLSHEQIKAINVRVERETHYAPQGGTCLVKKHA
jgi:hypothetical protein